MKQIDEYHFKSKRMPITVKIYQADNEYVPIYHVTLSVISETTKIILEKIRHELINEVNLGMIEITEQKKHAVVEEKFKTAITDLIQKYFPTANEATTEFLTSYLIQKSLGLSEVEILLADQHLEELAINCATEPIWVYHRKHGWLKTNITPQSEEQIKHWSTMIARKVGRQITVLQPLLDATIGEGDRVNATISPVSTKGHTITIRKTAAKPIVITDMLKTETLSLGIASLIWLAIQYEMSCLVSGGTASGKTSMLNCCAAFFPPDQRIISIEDTREILLPSYAHWVPMLTKLANAEGKGQITMIDLLVNSLRQRPDRIIVGEIRRKKEAEVLFEAIHTGHSVYATLHANNAEETITRLTNPPIEISKTMLPAISLIINQYRNRRSGKRKTFEIAEILKDGDINVLERYNPAKDNFQKMNDSKEMLKTLQMYTGIDMTGLNKDLNEKQHILKYLVDQGYDEVETIGRVMAEYYTNKENLLKYVKEKKYFGKQFEKAVAEPSKIDVESLAEKFEGGQIGASQKTTPKANQKEPEQTTSKPATQLSPSELQEKYKLAHAEKLKQYAAHQEKLKQHAAHQDKLKQHAAHLAQQNAAHAKQQHEHHAAQHHATQHPTTHHAGHNGSHPTAHHAAQHPATHHAAQHPTAHHLAEHHDAPKKKSLRARIKSKLKERKEKKEKKKKH